jgi:fructose-specific phosphotransferase system IIC component
MLEHLRRLRQHLLTGVSFVIPFIACGGIMIAIAIAFAPMTAKGPDFSQAPTLQLILSIGTAAFRLMLPVLAGYIAYSVAGKPGLVPGFVGGYLSGEVKAGAQDSTRIKPWLSAGYAAEGEDGFHGFVPCAGVHLFHDTVEMILDGELREIQV